MKRFLTLTFFIAAILITPLVGVGSLVTPPFVRKWIHRAGEVVAVIVVRNGVVYCRSNGESRR